MFKTLGKKFSGAFNRVSMLARRLVRRLKALPLKLRLLVAALLVLAVATFTIALVTYVRGSNEAAPSSRQEVSRSDSQDVGSPVAAPEDAEPYVIVAERRTSTQLSVHVYAPNYSKDALIQLNDALLDHYKDSYSFDQEAANADDERTPALQEPKANRLMITYYNDKEMAQVKANAVDSAKLPDDVKKKIGQSTLAFLLADKYMGTNLVGRSLSSDGDPLLKRYDQ